MSPITTPNRQRVASALAALAERSELTDDSAVVHLPETTADDIGVTRRSVENSLTAFERAGAITWHRKSKFGTRRPYWVVAVHTDHPMWAELRKAVA